MRHKNKISLVFLITCLISGCSTTVSSNLDEPTNKPLVVQSATTPTQSETKTTNTEVSKNDNSKVKQKTKPSVVKSTSSQRKSPKKITTPKKQTIRYRVGAVCNDGWVSEATGRGACSWHGGVAYWLYNE